MPVLSFYKDSVDLSEWGWGVVALVLMVGAVYAFYGPMVANQRRQDMGELAVRRGFTFSAAFNSSLAGNFPGYACLHTGEESYAYNVVKGTVSNRPIYAFDYHYQTNTHRDKNGEEKANHYGFSAVGVCSDVPLKSLVLRPEGFLAGVAQALGDNAIEFESAEFNKRYHVSAIDRRWAYDVLNPRTIGLLLDAPPFRIEFDFNSVMAFGRSSARLSVEEIEAAIDLLTGILDGLPDYLVRQQQGLP